MSGLKIYYSPSPHCTNVYYLKSEADKVIAEKDKEIAKLKEQVALLQAEFIAKPGV